MSAQTPLEFLEAREESQDIAVAKFNLEAARLARFQNNGSRH